MRKNKFQLFLWAILASLFLIALSSILQTGPKLIGKSFVDTDDFKVEMDAFYNVIGPTVLNPLDVEEAKKRIAVTKAEIEEHRTRYGTLSEQIANIHDQYESRIVEAKDAQNKGLEEALLKERDTKVTDIQKNFESDAHIEAKIRAEKAVVIERYIDEIKGSEVMYFPIAYQFTDVETGETFSAGDIEVPAAYQKKFTVTGGLFKASSIPSNDYQTEWFHYDSRELTVSSSPWVDTIARETNAAAELSSGEVSEYKNPIRAFEGIVVVPKKALAEGPLGDQVKEYHKKKYATYILWILGALSAVVLFKVLKFKKEWVTEIAFAERYGKLPMDVKAGVLFLSLFFTMELIYIRAERLFSYYSQDYSGIWTDRMGWLFALAIAVAWIVFQLVNSLERWKHKGVLEQDIVNSYTIRFFGAWREMFLKRKIGFQTFILLIGFFLAGIGFVCMFIDPIFIVMYMVCVLFFGFPALYIFVKRSAYLNRILVATEAMAAGRLNEEIKVEGKSPLAEHAKNLNNLREGVRVSMSEQAKSERLKTELITNVSHDLRTPLTSIITYTDLLKNEDLSMEERKKYVDILDKKSQRLKTLIEDLFEVSKMASGNLELHKQRVDLAQLLQQALAEHDEEISKMGLDFRVSAPDNPLVAYVDGKRWWRVLDNLIVNAIKYTLPGTRVYITLRKVGETAEFVVKNVTKYELGENTDELFERFKRADTSRHTDGSGLGLAIAQSIVDMHNGNMKIEVDGDLFKVTVVVAAV